MKKFKLIGALVALLFVLGPVSVTDVSSAEAASAQPAPVPTASQLCYYIAWHNIGPASPQPQVLFAQYEVLTTSYVQARCLVSWACCGGYLFAGYNARVYSNGSWAGPYGLVWS